MKSKMEKAIDKVYPMFSRMISGKLQFYKYEDLIEIVRKSARNLDKDFDVVIGIPRSGLLPASILSTMLGTGLSTFEEVRLGFKHLKGSKVRSKSFDKVLLVDDSTGSGYTMKTYKSKLESLDHVGKVVTYSVFGHDKGYSPDYIGFIPKKGKRIYEWNLLHRDYPFKVGFDLDGVLSDDRFIHGVKDKDRYKQLLTEMRVMYKPAFKIEFIVTCRLEEFRIITEDWLHFNNIDFRKLIMWNYKDWDNRKGKYLQAKIDMLKNLNLGLFIESDDRLAKEINHALGLPCLSIEEMRLYT